MIPTQYTLTFDSTTTHINFTGDNIPEVGSNLGPNGQKHK